MKTCIKCGTLKELKDYSNRSDSKDGHSNMCRSCDKEKAKLYRKKTNGDKKKKALEYHSKNIDDIKICTMCGKGKKLNEYYIKVGTKDGHSPECKTCKKKIALDSHYNNREKHIIKCRNYYDKNKEIIKMKNREYYHNNKVARLSKNKEYRKNNSVKLTTQKKEYLRNRRINNPGHVIVKRTRARIREFFNSKYIKKNKHTEEMIGCKYNILKGYLDNLGYQKEMHIDHIIPLSVFDVFNEDHFKIMFNYRNLQPLSAVDNLKKGNKLTVEWEKKLIEISESLNINPFPIINYISKQGKEIYYDKKRA